MPHMLAQEHMGIVDALRYGTARTAATIAAALSAIGSTTTILVLTNTGDGVWTLASNLTIPANVTLWIPAGVTVSRGAGVILTVSGPLVSFQPNWEVGPGVTLRNAASTVYTEFTRVVASSGVNAPFPGICYVAGASGDRQVIIDTTLSPGNAVINFVQPTFPTWGIGHNQTGQWFVNHPGGGARIILTDTGLGLDNTAVGSTPTHALHMFQDDAFKATTLWSVPSDKRLKDVQGDYPEGRAFLLSLPRPKIFRWNGKGGTVADGTDQVGYIAQDLAKVAPALVSTYQDKLDPADPAPVDIHSTNLSPLTFALVNACREQDALIVTLQEQVATLESTMSALAARLTALEGGTPVAAPAVARSSRPRRRSTPD